MQITKRACLIGILIWNIISLVALVAAMTTYFSINTDYFHGKFFRVLIICLLLMTFSILNVIFLALPSSTKQDILKSSCLKKTLYILAPILMCANFLWLYFFNVGRSIDLHLSEYQDNDPRKI